jgi:hypothetical protein
LGKKLRIHITARMCGLEAMNTQWVGWDLISSTCAASPGRGGRMSKLHLPRKLQIIAYSLVLAALPGCGSGTLQPAPAPPRQPSGATTAAQLRIGDAPADRVFSFEITLGSSITFNPADGGAPSVIMLNSNRLELSHTAAKLQPITLTALEPGTYSSADMIIQSPTRSNCSCRIR